MTFTVACTDTGPAYEQSEVKEYADTQPSSGTLSEHFAGDPFTYTPASGFKGTDSFDVNSFDGLGFGSDRGTVTITVVPRSALRCGGRPATMVGTTGKDLLKGTRGKDVIVGLGGRDKIKGRGGKDIICGGGGKDVLLGGLKRDRLFGQGGRDALRGGPGRDTCVGGPGADRVLGCE